MLEKGLFWATIVFAVLALGSLLGVLGSKGAVRRLQALVGTLLWGGLAGLLGAVLVILHTFHVFTGEALIAVVETRRLGNDRFELTYTPSASGEPSRTMELTGDQWAISGGVVKWQPWLASLGLQTYHKPLRLTGQFASAEKQRATPPSLYELDERVDRFWEVLYWVEQRVPLLDAVYGSSAYVYVEPDMIDEVYVTATGYLIRRSRKAR